MDSYILLSGRTFNRQIQADRETERHRPRETEMEKDTRDTEHRSTQTGKRHGVMKQFISIKLRYRKSP